MLGDARNISEGSELETDVCVVGAGAAGISLALEWAGGPFRVMLLESGGLEPEPETQELYQGRVFGRAYFRLDEARTRQFGGSTNCWHGICRPLEPQDFEAREWVPGSGWPVDAETLRPFYERAQRVCGLATFDYGAGPWTSPEHPPLPFADSTIESRVFQVSPQRFGALHRGAVARAPNVVTVLHANAVELELAPDSGRVARVRVATLAGGRFAVKARYFVLATGGIENARLLLASRGARREGLGNAHDLVGRSFMEHLQLLAGAFLPASASLPLGFYRLRAAAGIHVTGLLTPSAQTQRAERILGFASFLAEEVELPEFEGALARTLAELDGGAAPAGSAVVFMNEVEQAPNPASRIRLIEERDRLGMPRVQLEWRLSAIDKRTLLRGHQVLARALGRAGLGRLQILLDPDERRWPSELDGGRHHMGTTRMHEDPAQGVVDAHCRVHDLDNLYVAGSSVFPTSGSSKPTLTLVALALRLADHIKERLR